MPCPILTRGTQIDRTGELLDTTEKQPDSEDVCESVAIDVSPVVTVDVVSSVFLWRW